MNYYTLACNLSWCCEDEQFLILLVEERSAITFLSDKTYGFAWYF